MASWAKHDPPWITDWIERVRMARANGLDHLTVTAEEEWQFRSLLRPPPFWQDPTWWSVTMCKGMPLVVERVECWHG